MGYMYCKKYPVSLNFVITIQIVKACLRLSINTAYITITVIQIVLTNLDNGQEKMIKKIIWCED